MDSNETSSVGDDRQPLPLMEVDEVERQHEGGDHNPTPPVFYAHEVSDLARHLGAEMTRARLLPRLLIQLRAMGDAVKASFAEGLGNFGVLVGGVAYVHTLFPILEALTTDENASVREKAVSSLMRLSEDFTPDEFRTRLIPVIERLGASEFSSSRGAACALIAYSYTRGDDVIRGKLRKLYKKLTCDSIIEVRETAADALDRLAKIVEGQHVKNLLIIFKRFALDTSEKVRVNIVKAALSLGSRLSTAQVQATILPTIKILAKDTTVSVRLEVAKIMLRLQLAIGKNAAVIHLVPIFHTLLGDPDTSIREVSSKQINKFCRKIEKRFLNEIILQTILPDMLRLVDDASVKVRSELASVAMDLCPIFCERDVNKYLWQIFLHLLGDSSNQVRVSIVTNMGGLKRYLTVNQFDTHVVPFIKYMSANSAWRSRIETLTCIYRIATKLGKKFFCIPLVEICVDLLVDRVYTVREGMGIVLGKIVSTFGPEWAKDKLLKKVLGIATRERYLHRLSCLSCLGNLAKHCGTELTTSTILPVVLALSKDTVPNVRFNVAKTLHHIAHVLAESSLEKQVLPVLRNLQDDKDVDVVFFANEAFNVISEMCKAPNIQEESKLI